MTAAEKDKTHFIENSLIASLKTLKMKGCISEALLEELNPQATPIQQFSSLQNTYLPGLHIVPMTDMKYLLFKCKMAMHHSWVMQKENNTLRIKGHFCIRWSNHRYWCNLIDNVFPRCCFCKQQCTSVRHGRFYKWIYQDDQQRLSHHNQSLNEPFLRCTFDVQP